MHLFDYLITNLPYGISINIYFYPNHYYFLNPKFIKFFLKTLFFFLKNIFKKSSVQSELCDINQVNSLFFFDLSVRFPFLSVLQMRYSNLPFCWKQLRMMSTFLHLLKCIDKIATNQIKNLVKSGSQKDAYVRE